MSPELRKELKAATENLLYPSETDAEFEVVTLKRPYPWERENVAVEVVQVRQFFAELRDGPDAAGYHTLYGLLCGRLGDLRIHRVGEVNVDIYITGVEQAADSADSPTAPATRQSQKDSHGVGNPGNAQRAKENRVGLKTHAVET